MLRVGLVGVGAISKSHISAWSSMDNVDLVALCDVRKEQLEMHTGKKLYTEYDEMLENEQLDIVDICLPTHLHVEYSLKAIEKGIHVLCEKPISLNREDVKMAYDEANKHQVKFMIAHVIRFWPEYVMLKEIYDSKRYGKLLSGTMYRLSSMPKRSWNQWMMDEKLSGMVPFDLHIHDCDFLVHAFGKPEKVVPRRLKEEKQDYLSVVYEYPGFFIETEAAWYAGPYPFSAGYRFMFENAVVEYKDGICTAYEADGNVVNLSETAGQDVHSFVPESDGYANEIKYFAKCVEENRPVEMVKPEELEMVIQLLNTL